MQTNARNRGDIPSASMVEPQVAESFWAVVKECLIQFHGFSHVAAVARVADVRSRLDQLASSSSEEIKRGERTFDGMIYHEEPWYIACNLAGKEIPLTPNRAAYEQIIASVEQEIIPNH